MLRVQYPLVMIMNKKGRERKILKYAQEKRKATQSSFIIWTGNVSAWHISVWCSLYITCWCSLAYLLLPKKKYISVWEKKINGNNNKAGA